MTWPGKSQIYAFAVTNVFNAGTAAINASSDTFKIALYGTGTPVNTGVSLGSTEYGTTWNTCTEVGNSGTYAAGGSNLISPGSAQSTNTWVFSCTTPNSWTGATINAFGALIYDHTTGGAVNPGLCYLDFLGSQSVVGGTFTVTYAPNIAVITLT